MIDIFLPIKDFLKRDKICIDNVVFQLHYRLTVIILLVFFVLITTKQFFGEPIQCTMGSNNPYKSIVDSYCWMYGTYTLKSRLNGKSLYPGLGTGTGNKNDEMHHNYYQWVSIVFLGQAAMFYVPRYLWKIWEGGKLYALASEMSGPFVTKDWSESRRYNLLKYFNNSVTLPIYSHNMYAMRYVFCEMLNLANVVGQIYITDKFLGGNFWSYGSKVAAFQHRTYEDTLKHVSPLDIYFPKITKCTLKTIGPSGSDQIFDGFCVLSLNIVNEKIFVILWFWLIILSVLSTISFLYRIVSFSCHPLRTMVTQGQVRIVRRRMISKIVRRFSFGDWFVLYLLGKNINPFLFKELLQELSKEIDSKAVNV